MPYFHSATFALNVPPNFIVSSLIFAFVSDTEDGAKKLFVNNVLPSASFTCCITKVWSSNDTKLDSMVPHFLIVAPLQGLFALDEAFEPQKVDTILSGVDHLRTTKNKKKVATSFTFPANAVPHTIAATILMKNFFIFSLLMRPLL